VGPLSLARGGDLDFASSLQHAIERGSVNGRRLRVWLDDTDIPAGASIPKRIEDGLRDSQRFGILMTRNYFASNSGWTDAEWHSALFQDPDNRTRKLLPLLAGECDVPFLLAHLRRIDIRDKTRLQRGVDQIIAALQLDDSRTVALRGALRLESALPDDVNETLFSNVFALEGCPSEFYVADIAPHLLSRRSPRLSKSRFEMLQRSQITPAQWPPYHLDYQRLVTFADPSRADSPFRSSIVSASIRQVSLGSPTLTSATRRLVVALLNATMHAQLDRIGALLPVPEDDRVYYRPADDGGARSISWPAGQRMATRLVAKPVPDPKTGAVRFWLHHSAGVRFLQLGPAYVLQIRPSYVLTSNGTDLMNGPRVGKTINRWMLRERNLQIFRHVMFWRWTLASIPTAIETGVTPLRISDVPVDFTTQVGIQNDHTDLRRGLESVDFDDEDPLGELNDGGADAISADEDNT